MVTDDERRAVAARIRELRKHAWDESSVFDLLGCAVEECGLDDTDQLFARLADLIEPEPERTCHIKISDCTDSLGQKMYRCSECGSLTTDDACFFEGEPDIDGFSYCPNCGAKVVEE